MVKVMLNIRVKLISRGLQMGCLFDKLKSCMFDRNLWNILSKHALIIVKNFQIRIWFEKIQNFMEKALKIDSKFLNYFVTIFYFKKLI